MEKYDGVIVLATNLRKNVYDAFLRRLQHIVEFPDPDEAHRRRIWQMAFSPEAPLGDDVDFGILARVLDLPGGNIKKGAAGSPSRAGGPTEARSIRGLGLCVEARSCLSRTRNRRLAAHAIRAVRLPDRRAKRRPRICAGPARDLSQAAWP
jgi:SpoVK/Ycf46/Vps4 family AAA+-type ATPase